MLLFFTLLRVHNINSSTDFYNRDLQTTIILFTRNVSSHKIDWILSESPLLALSCLLYRMVSRLVNALGGEYLCLRKISINVNKLFIVIFVFYLLCPCSVVVACLLVYPIFLYTDVVVDCFLLYSFFILMLLLYFCLFIDHVNKPIMFVFGAFLCHFNNTIFIFVTIYTYIYIYSFYSSREHRIAIWRLWIWLLDFILDRSVRCSILLPLNT